jgi:D-amino-acid oxidase
MPFHCDDPRTDRWAIETLDEIFPFAKDPQNACVEIVPAVTLHRDHKGPAQEDFQELDYKDGRGGKSPKLPAWSSDPRIQFQHLTVEMLSWQNYVYRLRIPTQQQLKDAGYLYSWFFQAPIIDPPKMLMVRIDRKMTRLMLVSLEHWLNFSCIEHARRNSQQGGRYQCRDFFRV